MDSKEITYCNAETAVDNGTYRTLSDDMLAQMHKACLNVGGPNLSAVDRIRKKGDIIRAELDAREQRKRENNSLLVSAASAELCRPAPKLIAESEIIAWDESRLLKLISDQIEESLNLEYKRAAALSKEGKGPSEITKDISALANSSGGVLIYGIAEHNDPAKEHLPERIDPVLRTQFSKEWLEHRASQIRPRISDIKIHSVQLSTAPEHVAYVVEVPAGSTAHQAADCKYYRRYNFESVPMADHEVRDVMNRKASLRITVSANCTMFPKPTKEGYIGELIFSVNNETDVFARYVAFFVFCPLRIGGRLVEFEKGMFQETRDGIASRLSFSNHNSAPLFPRGALKEYFQFRTTVFKEEPVKQLNELKWFVFADSMPMEEGALTMNQLVQ